MYNTKEKKKKSEKTTFFFLIFGMSDLHYLLVKFRRLDNGFVYDYCFNTLYR